jgi:2-polyprenyl-3-methyl-5-hydroxy-6-metoxy-1,4-benzoquinol methylase
MTHAYIRQAQGGLELAYTGERLIPDRFNVGDRILIEHLDRYRFAGRMLAKKSKHPRILDAPCGVGYGAVLLAEQCQAEVTGLDNDPDTIAYGEQRYKAVRGLSFRLANLDVDVIEHDHYDAAVCFEGIEHVVHQRTVARKLCESVKKGGIVMMSTPRKDGPGAGSTFHTRELDRDDLYDLCWPHLQDVQMYGQDLLVGDQPPDENARYYVLVGTR